ncbi:MAG: recombination mediator RecR [Waddliaceae bacterium]
MKYPNHLLQIIDVLKFFPGVGGKTAERYAFDLLEWSPEHLKRLTQAVKEIPEKLKSCSECSALISENECPYCTEERQSTKNICVIATKRDLFSIEQTGEYNGLYHVLGGLLSPLEGIGPEAIALKQLRKRIFDYQLSEVVIALDSTLEGDATALYIKEELSDLSVKFSRIAFGVPMGSSLDYVDGGTLARAFSGRRQF